MEAQLGSHVENLELGLKNLADTFTAAAMGDDDREAQFFPFVRVSNFETHGEHARERSKMEAIAYAPLVTSPNKVDWETYAVQHHRWIDASRATYVDHLPSSATAKPVYLPGKIAPFIYKREENGVFTEPVKDSYSTSRDNDTDQTSTTASSHQVYAPIWYLSPPPFNPAIVNFDVLSDPDYQVVLRQAIDAQTSAFSPVMNVEPFSSLQVSDADHVLYHERFTSNVTTTMGGGIGYQLPHSLYAQPVFDSRANKDTVVGVLWGALAWDAYLANLLPQGVLGLIVVLHSSCAQDKSFTYELNGVEPTYLGARDLHDSTYNHMVRRVPFYHPGDHNSSNNVDGFTTCQYSLDIYPSKTFQESFESSIAVIATITVGATFLLVALIFVIYDQMVKSRNDKITQVAERSNAVVNSLFPEAVRDRLLEQEKEQTRSGASKSSKGFSSQPGNPVTSKPIADLFPECTVSWICSRINNLCLLTSACPSQFLISFFSFF